MQRSDIGVKIRLFNRAYTIAWERISEAMKARKPDLNEALAGIIRQQISLGLKDPAAIATEALDELLKGMRIRQ
jgi:hypothetical protein